MSAFDSGKLPGNLITSAEWNALTNLKPFKTISRTSGADYYCDGTNDDIQIQAAVDLMHPVNGTVYLGPGTFVCSSAVDLSDKNVHLLGDSTSGTVLQRSGGTYVVKCNNSAVTTRKQSVSNLCIDGVNKFGYGLTLDNVIRTGFYNLHIKNCDVGLYMRRNVVNTFINPYIELCNTGIHMNSVVGDTNAVVHNTFLGGEIRENATQGVFIQGYTCSPVFFGVVIQGNTTNQVVFETVSDGGSDYLCEWPRFEFCHFENVSGDANKVIINMSKDGGATNYSPRHGVFIGNHYGTAGGVNYTAVDCRGSYNHFKDEIMAGSAGNASFIITGTGNQLESVHRMSSKTFVLTDTGTATVWPCYTAPASLDLSGGATDLVTYHATTAGLLTGYTILYTQASSADVDWPADAVRIGRIQDNVALDDDYFDENVSEASKPLGYSKHFSPSDLTNTVIATGDTVTVGTGGGKTGAGEILVTLNIIPFF